MGQRARCYGTPSVATGAFRLPDAAAPMGLVLNMADTTNATYVAASTYRLEFFSGAKIIINPETYKLFPIFFTIA